ncbi:hypothetical protein B7486_73405, partial [cyanobacterium TDX16]
TEPSQLRSGQRHHPRRCAHRAQRPKGAGRSRAVLQLDDESARDVRTNAVDVTEPVDAQLVEAHMVDFGPHHVDGPHERELGSSEPESLLVGAELAERPRDIPRARKADPSSDPAAPKVRRPSHGRTVGQPPPARRSPRSAATSWQRPAGRVRPRAMTDAAGHVARRGAPTMRRTKMWLTAAGSLLLVGLLGAVAGAGGQTFP